MSTMRLASAPPDRLRSIGEVIAELRAEFPDISPSKLRFLESEGLVTPARLANGYRKYTESHVQRLRLVLGLQRDQYLPLRVIKEKLAAHDAGTEPIPDPRTVDVRTEPVPDGDGTAAPAKAEVPQRLIDLTAAAFDPNRPAQTYGREEFLAKSGLTRAQLKELEESRLVAPMASGRYHSDALVVASIVAGLAQRGVDVRHIKPTRHTVDREVGNIENLLAAQRKRQLSGTVRDQQELAAAQRELASGFVALHAALLRAAL
jgi:DNA-binding transcriptional MerR regulator